MKNKELASLFHRIGDALDIKGEQTFKILAYRKAARILEDLTDDVETLVRDKTLETIEGIGHGIAQKIEEYVTTGRMAKYEEAVAGLPPGLLDLLDIPGLGAKTVGLAFKELHVGGLDDLKRVIADGSLAGLRGMGDKKAENIGKGIALFEQGHARISIYEASAVSEAVMAHLRKAPGIGRIEAAGSLRRMKETVGDIDILAEGKNGASVIDHFVRVPGLKRVLGRGDTKASILLALESSERQVDLRVVGSAAYGAALQYFTGSKEHSVKLRGLAKAAGLKISEYGVFRGAKKIAGRDEEGVYKALDLPWIPPELREDRGEIECAREGRLPRLVEAADLRGDLHCHTRTSDGHMALEGLADEARALGYAYIAVCDHSRSAAYAGGLTVDRLKDQWAEIDALNRRWRGFRILKGSEVDILGDGRLDFPDEVLERLDFVVASVHSGFKNNVTGRMVKALENPWVDTIGHPSGRLLSGREGYDVDLEKVIEAAAARGKALELNSHFDRLDLSDVWLRKAKDAGVMISIGTDTHDADGPAMIRFGLGIARRGWLEKKDVLNTRTVDGLARWRKTKRR
ncbi:MAG: DNA polymerase/3'-5' exonuclease PolX [Candidatus Aminicenantales bacterium]|jgi:DNA polymerase (family 10)